MIFFEERRLRTQAPAFRERVGDDAKWQVPAAHQHRGVGERPVGEADVARWAGLHEGVGHNGRAQSGGFSSFEVQQGDRLENGEKNSTLCLFMNIMFFIEYILDKLGIL